MLSHKSVDGNLKQTDYIFSQQQLTVTKIHSGGLHAAYASFGFFLLLINLMLFENINKVNKVLQFWNLADTNIVLKLA